MTNFLPQINVSKCTGCNLCIKVCPYNVLALINNIAIVANSKACDYTGICQEICPTKAISLVYEIVFQTDPHIKGNIEHKTPET